MITIDGQHLTVEEVASVADGRERELVLAESARWRMERSRAHVEMLLAQNERIYGVTTGFGRLSEVFISPPRRSELQLNLIRSHSSGLGQRLSAREVRTIMLLRANALAHGCSGCRVELVERLLALLAGGMHPVVPEVGSVGASGDLAPLAHVALGLIGEGEMEVEGVTVSTAQALARAGLAPLRLVEKEGLALINGTQGTTGFTLLALLGAETLVETAEVAGAMTLEALRGTPEPFRPPVHQARPHPGQITSAARLWSLLADSEIRESHRYNDPRVQDAYSLRCMPQVHGAAREVLRYVRGIVEVEINSATDNPLIFPEEDLVVSAGNFHAQVVAQAADFLAIALTDLASISERRLERLLNPDLSELPAFLAKDPGIQSGLMITQLAAADLLAEMKVLAHPASVDSVPTSGNKEDHVSMGFTAGRKVRRTVECLEYVLALELLAGAQALEFLRPLRPGRGVKAAYDIVRRLVSPLDGDRVLTGDIEALRTAVGSGAFAAIAAGADAAAPAREAPAKQR
ncbi:MAG: histidine ammonia-lyase [Gemmatimonadales bacterium]|nr:histidine ammonia-lyase [Gemmatimonadales bacterium]